MMLLCEENSLNTEKLFSAQRHFCGLAKVLKHKETEKGNLKSKRLEGDVAPCKCALFPIFFIFFKVTKTNLIFPIVLLHNKNTGLLEMRCHETRKKTRKSSGVNLVNETTSHVKSK